MSLRNCHILVVEDEYMLVVEIEHLLKDAGAVVVGPESSVEGALSRIDGDVRIDAAMLDVNLGDHPVYPVADALVARGIPFVFTSGYDENFVAHRYPGTVNCQKPFETQWLLQTLEKTLHNPE